MPLITDITTGEERASKKYRRDVWKVNDFSL
jgi:hypothetical protein